MKDWKKAEDIAAYRVQLISPLLADGLDGAKVRDIKAQICQQHGVSERSLRRYLAQYRKHGFEGLKPKGKQHFHSSSSPFKDLIEQAILLRREVPSRSISQIIQILEWEGKALPGQLKRSTLQEKLAERGYSARHMRMYAETGIAARRFQKRHRNQLWQSDIKHGPYLPIGPGGKKLQVYLVAMQDDATRFVLHAQFYPTIDQSIVEDCFRKSIQKYGVPESVYFDNGSQYRTKWMSRTCSKLGIRLRYTKSYSPESKGKIERLNRTIDTFLSEVSLNNPQTLEQLNEQFQVWLSECYQHRPHASLDENASPETAYRSDRKALRFTTPEAVADAFLHAEKRKVDKSGCISFMGKKYEVGLSVIGQAVDVIYDPADISQLTIECSGHKPWQVKELSIGESAGQRPPLPSHLDTQPAKSSRLLDAAKEQHQQRRERTTPAVRYEGLWEGETEHV
ncbi:DDE-type integrase/transposase/recombinase [Alicyclobacillus sp. SO9]|uniref:DDE-type integrase/transposase/recombinase n=1 Tax=Alicyclobacillus sp. SO9 TaxID=2665646 RepID=UPI0018E768C6|nr:DDE-type integrase/transposase/recombinase [Alicyclobacillus sp. SO9]QQE77832.1 DDE-type integrase/transposase/recombinase [Alicyclobacillus sp. SO9]